MIGRNTLCIAVVLLALVPLSQLRGEGRIRFFTGSKNDKAVTETIRLEVRLQSSKTGKIYDYTGANAITGTVEIPPDCPACLKNEAIEEAIRQAIADAPIPAFSGSSIVVAGNSNSYVSVDENNVAGQHFNARIENWTCTNKSDQKGLSSVRIPGGCSRSCVCVALWDDEEGARKVVRDHVFQIGYVNTAGAPILVEVRTHGEYEDPVTGKTLTGFKPVAVILKEAAGALVTLSAAAGTPLDGVTIHRRGLFFDAAEQGVLYGEDSPWLVQDQAVYPAGSARRAREWIDACCDREAGCEIEVKGSAREEPLRGTEE